MSQRWRFELLFEAAELAGQFLYSILAMIVWVLFLALVGGLIGALLP